MLAPVDNQAIVLAVLGDRYRLPVERLEPGRLVVAELPHPSLPVRALTRDGGAVAAADPAWVGLLRQHLRGPAEVRGALAAVAAAMGGRLWSTVARTGVAIPPPAVEVAVLDAADPRLPDWVVGHFAGEAWVVFGDGGEVLSTAVLKRYDDRLREISVGTAEAARGRGLAKAVVAAAARAVLAEGRAVLYNHEPGNLASARVAEAVGLHELARYYAVGKVSGRPASSTST